MKKALRAVILVLLVACLLMPEALAIVPYQTYTYDLDGNVTPSPHAYVPDRIYKSADIGLDVDLKSPTDIRVDDYNNVYIADPANNRIIVLDSNFQLIKEIKKFTNTWGVPDNFNAPAGVFIREDELYICDTENNRIVLFNIVRNKDDGKFIEETFSRVIFEPESTAFPEGSTYKPIACAVDTAGRIYVVSSTTNYGIISMNSEGSFLGFLGAQKTSPSAWQIFWRMFQTKEQRQALTSLVPTEYNNIDIDESGFIYVTTSSIDESKVASSISSKSTSGAYAPVKKLNAQGTDVMMRTGFWPPSGEVTVAIHSDPKDTDAVSGVSLITDVALGEAGMWTIADSKRQRFFTYDAQGNLLFAFGDVGPQIGNNQRISSICYMKDKFIVLDKSTNAFTVYKRTAYGNDLIAAIRSVEDRKYDESAEYWKKVVLRNANYDEAYVGIGDSLYRAGKYEEAEDYFSYAYDANDYSKCYTKIRKTWIEKYIIVIPIVIVVICVVLTKFFGFTRKFNDAGQKAKDKRTFKEALIYGFHIIFHPFDGFWDLKHEKRGNMKAGVFFIVLTILAYFYYDLGKSFWYDPYNNGTSIFGEITGVLVPIGLWVLANWCLTTLFEGEGSFMDILKATSYSLLPLPMMLIPATLLTNILSLDESAVITLLVSIGYIWVGFLLVISTMVTHDYTFGKNLITVIGTLVGMVIVMFIALLFSGLIMKVWSFIYNIYTELTLRV